MIKPGEVEEERQEFGCASTMSDCGSNYAHQQAASMTKKWNKSMVERKVSSHQSLVFSRSIFVVGRER